MKAVSSLVRESASPVCESAKYIRQVGICRTFYRQSFLLYGSIGIILQPGMALFQCQVPSLLDGLLLTMPWPVYHGLTGSMDGAAVVCPILFWWIADRSVCV